MLDIFYKKNINTKEKKKMCVFVEDADSIDSDSPSLNVVFKDKKIANYLNSNNCLGLAGVKGQGKTFLLKVKRKQIIENQSGICLPLSKQLDTVDSSLKIDISLSKILKDYNVWVSLWKFSIGSAILTSGNVPTHLKAGLKPITKRFLNIRNPKHEPSIFLSYLLSCKYAELQILLNDTFIIMSAIRTLNKDFCIFIDKLDQSFSKYLKNDSIEGYLPVEQKNMMYWYYAQYSLADAAYEIYTSNPHIKIYYAIRQEVLEKANDMTAPKARNINSFITLLDYSKQDLKDMYFLYIRNIQKENLFNSLLIESKPSEAFIGYEELEHSYITNAKENVFDYIYRHTFKRPCDMMKICKALSLEHITTQSSIKSIVNTQAQKLLDQYIKEIIIFLPYNAHDFSFIYNILPGNVFNLELAKRICSTFYNQKYSGSCNMRCSDCHELKLFSILHNIGLLGIVQFLRHSNSYIIEFSNIGHAHFDDIAYRVPTTDYYFLHPTISTAAISSRGALLPYHLNKSIVIGDGNNYPLYNNLKSDITAVSKNLFKNYVFISSTIYDLKHERELIKNNLIKRQLHPVMSEESDFNIDNADKVHSHDLCINEVKHYKNLIFIIGNAYGGEYKGTKYIKEKNEIISLSNNKITSPSISLMELYIAKKRKIKIHIFASKRIESQYKSGKLNPNVKNIIDFYNHLKESTGKIKGNWIIYYSDDNDLVKRLNKIKFV